MTPALPVLYSFRRCPYAMRARLAIAASGQACELREIVLRNKPAEMLQASPKGTVPVLVDTDGTVVEQSLDIMQWALHRNDPAQWLCPEQETADAMFALIVENDGAFKRHLDRYKYPERYKGVAGADTSRTEAADDSAQGADAGTAGAIVADTAEGADATAERDAGAAWLRGLDARLQSHPWLFGSRACLADMAIAPFVRQYAHTDAAWFAAQDWPALQAWLTRIIDSDAFAHVMQKWSPWTSVTEGVLFP